MKRLAARLKKTNVILSGIMMCVGIGILWVFYVAQGNLLDEVMLERSKVETSLVKRTYELEQADVRAKEADIDEYLDRQSRFAVEAIGKLDELSNDDLDDIVESYSITGLWVIDETNKVRYGTNGEEGMDASTFYSEFIDKDFSLQLEKVRATIGNTWTGPFKLSHYDEGGYMKYAYTSVRNPGNPSEVLVIETGASIDEIKRKRYGTDRFIVRHALPTSIVGVDIDVRAAKGQRNFLQAEQTTDRYTYRVTTLVDDLGGESLLSVEMNYKDIQEERRAFFQTLLIATALMIFIFVVAVLTNERRDYTEIVQGFYDESKKEGKM